MSEADLRPRWVPAWLPGGPARLSTCSSRALTRAARHPVEGTGADIRRRAGPWPGNRWCAVWYVRCFDGPPRRPGAFPSGLARGRPGSCDRSGICRSRARFITGVCAVLRLARPALVSGARRTADAERRRRPLSGSSSKLRLSAFAELLSTALALAHGVQGQGARGSSGHAPRSRWSSRRPARSRWSCRRRSREPANPAAAGGFPASQRLRRCARQAHLRRRRALRGR